MQKHAFNFMAGKGTVWWPEYAIMPGQKLALPTNNERRQEKVHNSTSKEVLGRLWNY